MDVESWRNSEKTILKSKRNYAHFDIRTDISKCWNYVSDPQKVASHGFYPFIHYAQDLSKYSRKIGGMKEKTRDICYAAHLDRRIFQYYNFLLNELYNQECVVLGMSETPIAYRTNLNKKNNIDFAKKAFNCIQKSRNCYVMIGDFTKFFDRLDHLYLKKQWRQLLHVSTLPSDHYAVFKNLTCFSYFELGDILKINHLPNTNAGYRKLNKQERALSTQQFKENIGLKKKNEICGIPQGSPMSGVLANIYMLELDKLVHDFVKSLGGLYMRYSDDFIIVLPDLDEDEAFRDLKYIVQLFNSDNYPGLELQPSKTQYFHYTSGKVSNCGSEIDPCADTPSQSQISFLGFTFNGEYVRIRDKTISKYYHRLNRKAKSIRRIKRKREGLTKKGNKVGYDELYKNYSVRGAKTKKGNFLTYVYHAQKKGRFENEPAIKLVTDRNMFKVRQSLNRKPKKGAESDG